MKKYIKKRLHRKEKNKKKEERRMTMTDDNEGYNVMKWREK